MLLGEFRDLINPDRLVAKRQMRICHGEEVMEEAHIGHGECIGRRAEGRRLRSSSDGQRAIVSAIPVCRILASQSLDVAILAGRSRFLTLDLPSFAAEATSTRLLVRSSSQIWCQRALCSLLVGGGNGVIEWITAGVQAWP